MRTIILTALALSACTSIAPATLPEGYALIGQTVNGDEYILESGMESYAECLQSESIYDTKRFEAVTCEDIKYD